MENEYVKFNKISRKRHLNLNKLIKEHFIEKKKIKKNSNNK